MKRFIETKDILKNIYKEINSLHKELNEIEKKIAEIDVKIDIKNILDKKAENEQL